jgi:hypothetical protein
VVPSGEVALPPGGVALPSGGVSGSDGRTVTAESASAGSDDSPRAGDQRAVHTVRASGWPAHPPRPSAERAAPPARDARDGQGQGHAPADEAPADRPDGTLGNRSSADSGSPRHGDAYAVTLTHRAPLRLVPGTSARCETAGTRDSRRDVQLFPG